MANQIEQSVRQIPQEAQPGSIKPYYLPVAPDGFKRYLRQRSHRLPPLDVNKLSAELFEWQERGKLRVRTAGDASIVLKYKEKEGAVTSVARDNTDIKIVQLQRTKPKGYRLNAGMNIVNFFVRQIEAIATHPENYGTERITMQPYYEIEGIDHASESGVSDYQWIPTLLGMSHSKEENLFVRDVKALQRASVIFSYQGK